MGGGGGGGGFGGFDFSKMGGGQQRGNSFSSLFSGQANTGPGSIYNFGNNQDNLWGWKG